MLVFLASALPQSLWGNMPLRDSLFSLPREAFDATSDSLVKHLLIEEGSPIRRSNRVRLLTSGQEKFDDLFDHIRQAQHHIHMEYFNFRNDSISHALFTLLAEKAEQGVEIRILFDDFGNWSNNRPLKRRDLLELRDLGIDIVKFDPIRFPYINHAKSRDHRKIVVIDGYIGYVGGMNVADYYINGLPKIGPWRDIHMRIEGDAVLDLQQVFIDMWRGETGRDISGYGYYIGSPNPPPADSAIAVAIVDREPNISPEAIKRAYAASIQVSDDRVRIINPYFVPTTSIWRAIRSSLKRGIQIEIMVPEKSDIPFTPDAMLHKLRKLSRHGAKVLLYQGGFHHSKIMTVDERFSTVGSANLNSRSLRYDYETNAFIFDRGFTAELDSLFDRDKEHCIPLDDDYWERRSLWRKFVGWFANLLTPFL